MDKIEKNQKNLSEPIFGSPQMREPAPSERIPKYKTPAEIAYQIVKDETFPHFPFLVFFIPCYKSEFLSDVNTAHTEGIFF